MPGVWGDRALPLRTLFFCGLPPSGPLQLGDAFWCPAAVLASSGEGLASLLPPSCLPPASQPQQDAAPKL